MQVKAKLLSLNDRIRIVVGSLNRVSFFVKGFDERIDLQPSPWHAFHGYPNVKRVPWPFGRTEISIRGLFKQLHRLCI